MKKVFFATIPVMLFLVAGSVMANTCEPLVWQIGDVEAAQMDNPCDEFNHPTIVYGEQDFYIGATPTSEFPWISRYDKDYAPIINIHFNADMPDGGLFSFSWSPGASGTETITVTLSLDGTETLGSITRNGTPNPAWWGNYERFIESFDVPSMTGDHILTITFSSGDGSVWDWLKLERTCPPPEPVTCPKCTTQKYLETVIVPSDGSTVWSVNVLQSGVKYLLEASGTYTYWPAQLPDAGTADAKYSLRPEGSYNPGPGPQWISGDDLPSPWTNYLEVLVDSSAVSWGLFNLDHIYKILLEGTNSQVGFKILDSYYGDNSGSLQVDIYKCVCPGDITVINKNKARVKNEIHVGAYTGGNSANGGSGGQGGHTGKVKAQKGGTAISGDGGNGGAGGDGGTIRTGDARAKGKVINVVNTNMTRIRR